MKTPKQGSKIKNWFGKHPVIIVVSWIVLLSAIAITTDISLRIHYIRYHDNPLNSQFYVIAEVPIGPNRYAKVLFDKRTGIQYIINDEGGITPRVNTDGGLYYENFEDIEETELGDLPYEMAQY